MIKQLSVFTSEVTRVAREVGTDGKLGGQAQVPEVTGVWKDLTESVNSMASNLTGQVRNIADVTIAVANGDLSKKITVDVRGEILQLKEAINTMVDQLRSFASEVTRVAREVGTDGKLGGQAIVPGVAGTWKDLTDSVNAMCGNLTAQVRNIAEVTTAVARGDLSRKITVDVPRRNSGAQGHHQHDGRPAQRVRLGSDARRARSRHRRQARRSGRRCPASPAPGRTSPTTSTSWRRNLTAQVRNIADVATAIAGGDLSKKITVNVSGEILQLKETHQHDGGSAQRLRRRSDARRARSRHRRQARRPGQRARRRRHLEGSDRQRQLDGRQPDGAGPQHRRGDHRGRERRPVARRSRWTCAAKFWS